MPRRVDPYTKHSDSKHASGDDDPDATWFCEPAGDPRVQSVSPTLGGGGKLNPSTPAVLQDCPFFEKETFLGNARELAIGGWAAHAHPQTTRSKHVLQLRDFARNPTPTPGASRQPSPSSRGVLVEGFTAARPSLPWWGPRLRTRTCPVLQQGGALPRVALSGDQSHFWACPLRAAPDPGACPPPLGGPRATTPRGCASREDRGDLHRGAAGPLFLSGPLSSSTRPSRIVRTLRGAVICDDPQGTPEGESRRSERLRRS